MLDEAEQTLKQGLNADPGSDALTAALAALYDATNYAAATALAAFSISVAAFFIFSTAPGGPSAFG